MTVKSQIDLLRNSINMATTNGQIRSKRAS